jgi:hypothetical protein
LSPFIKREGTFKLFGKPEGNFYVYLWSVVRELLSANGI